MTRTKDKLRDILNLALDELHKNDEILLHQDTNERSITHRYAVYLEKYFPGHHVDCEYNRMPKSGGGIGFDPKILDLAVGEISTKDLEAKTVFPDIIVHKRGENHSNLLVIEAKKSSNKERSHDYNKLNAFMRSVDASGLGYEFSAFIEFASTRLESDFELRSKDDNKW